MVTVQRKDLERIRCPHCGSEVDWLWQMTYRSPQLARLLFLCNRCEGLVRVEHSQGLDQDRLAEAV